MTKKTEVENQDLDLDFENELDTDLGEAEDKAEKENKKTIKSTGKPKQDADHIEEKSYDKKKMKKEDDHDEDEDEDLEEAYTSKSELMAKMVKYASGMSKDNLAQTVERIIHSAEEIAAANKSETDPDNNEAKNKASIKSTGKPKEAAHKLPMKEDLEAVFGSEDLTEDFRKRTETLFEAAVETRLGILREELIEEYEEKLSEAKAEYETQLEEATETILEETEQKVSDYLDYVVKEWMEENEVALRSNLKVEVTESFLQGLKGLFTEHYVEIPDDKVDVIEELTGKVQELKNELNENAERSIELQHELNEMKIDYIRSELAEGLTETQKDKFYSLTETISDYSDVDAFREKAGYLLESVQKSNTRKSSEQDLNEEVELEESDSPKGYTDPNISMYAKALSLTSNRTR